jgi:hypothetical protein
VSRLNRTVTSDSERRWLNERARKTTSCSTVILLELSDRTLSRQAASSTEVVEQLRSLSYALLAFSPEGSLERLEQQEYYDGENVLAVPDERLSAILA